ncbi:MAG: PadR family transcriptional regulator [Candidatus Enterenecus sp.]
MAREKLETLTEQMYYLLLALNEPGHGYAVMERAGELSHGRVRLGPGTLYTLLGRFEKEGLIALERVEDTRKVYRLTDGGREVLKGEYERLRRQVADGAAVFGEEDKS